MRFLKSHMRERQTKFNVVSRHIYYRGLCGDHVHAMKSIRDSQSLCNLSLHDLRLFAPIVLPSLELEEQVRMKLSCLKMMLRGLLLYHTFFITRS
jgi:hypothetical protein